MKRITAILTSLFFFLQPLSSLSFAAEDYSGTSEKYYVPTEPITTRGTESSVTVPSGGGLTSPLSRSSPAPRPAFTQEEPPPPTIDFSVTDLSEGGQTPILIPITPCAEYFEGLCFDSRETAALEQTLMDRVRMNFDLSKASNRSQKMAGLSFDFAWNPDGSAVPFDAGNGITLGLRAEGVDESGVFKLVLEDTSGRKSTLRLSGLTEDFKAFQITSQMITAYNPMMDLAQIAKMTLSIDWKTADDTQAQGFVEIATAGHQYLWNPDLNNEEIPEHPEVSIYRDNGTVQLTSQPDQDRYEMQFDLTQGGPYGSSYAGLQMDFVNEPGDATDITKGFVIGFEAHGTQALTLLFIDEEGRQASSALIEGLTDQFMNYVINPHMIRRRQTDFDFSRVKRLVVMVDRYTAANFTGHVVISSAKRVSYTGTLRTELEVPLVIPVYNDAGERLTVSAITRAPTNGTVTIASNGTSVIYTPQNTEDGPRTAIFEVEGFTAGGGSGSTSGTQSASMRVKTDSPQIPLPDPDPTLPPLPDEPDRPIAGQTVLNDGDIDRAISAAISLARAEALKNPVMPEDMPYPDMPSASGAISVPAERLVVVSAAGVHVPLGGEIRYQAWTYANDGGQIIIDEIRISVVLDGVKDLWRSVVTEVHYNRRLTYGNNAVGEFGPLSDDGSAQVTIKAYPAEASGHIEDYGSIVIEKEGKWLELHRHTENTEVSNSGDGFWSMERREVLWAEEFNKYGDRLGKDGMEIIETASTIRSTWLTVENAAVDETIWIGPEEPGSRTHEGYSSITDLFGKNETYEYGQVDRGFTDADESGAGFDYRDVVKVREIVTVSTMSSSPGFRDYGESREEWKWSPDALQLLEHRKDEVIWQMDYSVGLEWGYHSFLTELYDETSGDFVSRTAWADDSWLGGEHWGTSSFYYEEKVNGLTTDLFSRNIDYDDGLGTGEPDSALLFSCDDQACDELQFNWVAGGYFILAANYYIGDVGDLRAWYQIFEITELGLALVNGFSYSMGYPEIPDGWIRWMI